MPERGWRLTFNELLEQIETRRAQAIYSGIEPTEVWLGPGECAVLDEEVRSAFYVRHSSLGKALTNEVRGLLIRRSLEPGVRVGVTFPLPEGARPVMAGRAMPADLRAFCGKGGGD